MALIASAALIAGCASSTPTAQDLPSDITVTTSPTTATVPPTEAETTTSATEPPTTVPAALVAPDGDAFYKPPSPLPGSKPGDIIWARALNTVPAGSVGWQVLYRSLNLAGDPIAVSGVIIAPGEPSTEPRPVVSWAHGTTGMGDLCAPSRTYESGSALELTLVRGVIDRGWVWAATDYEGLGTPGVHPYLVGLSSARSVLDMARAASQLVETGVTGVSPVMIFGHSQGGGAALFAAEQAASYAPDLDVIGTAAGAPAGDLRIIVSATLSPTASNGFGLMAVEGLRAAYPDLPIDAVVNPSGVDVLDKIAAQCVGDTLATTIDPAALGLQNPEANDAWAAAIALNTAGAVVPSAPVFVYQGDADTTVPSALTDLTVSKYCSIDAPVELKNYAGAGHVDVVFRAIPDIVAFFEGRLAGDPAPTTC